MTDGDVHTEDCMAGQQIKDMTKGPPGRLLMIFAIPLMLGNICQQAVYNGRYHCCRTGPPESRLWQLWARWNGSCGWFWESLRELRRGFPY